MQLHGRKVRWKDWEQKNKSYERIEWSFLDQVFADRRVINEYSWERDDLFEAENEDF